MTPQQGEESAPALERLAPLGIIAGTGFYDLATLQDPSTEVVESAYGSARLVSGTWHGYPVVFLTRHGPDHTVPPHLVNYRANIAALAASGCTEVVAVNVTGAIDGTLWPGDLVCVDDFLDFTRGRPGTFFDGSTEEGVVHVDVTEAYDPQLRRELLDAAFTAEIQLRDGGVYACFEGPRFETPAEIRLARLAGGSVAGMTGVPEVTLAVEAGLRYAALSLVANPAAGVGATPIAIEDIGAIIEQSSGKVIAVLDALLAARARDLWGSTRPVSAEAPPAGQPTDAEPTDADPTDAEPTDDKPTEPVDGPAAEETFGNEVDQPAGEPAR